ncbi:hypothetical protein RF11_13390 [Thelohanellus kitauei]|uniref:Uncharacterized protein n=1 Tax=Thelohanellus kitauei TaxID=669202 RepID=A0A0C2ITU8_THEKT|nr:hypothetical protein RF11_13390 [Thelohanellus kitauei]
MIFNTFYYFSPYLITTTVINHTCPLKYTAQKFGILIFSSNNPFTHSIYHDSYPNNVYSYLFLIVVTTITQLARIFVYQYSSRQSIDFRLILTGWIIFSFFSESLQNQCVKANLSTLIQFPLVIFWLNTFDILIFSFIHIKIDIKPFKMTIISNKHILIDISPSRIKKNLAKSDCEVKFLTASDE